MAIAVIAILEVASIAMMNAGRKKSNGI